MAHNVMNADTNPAMMAVGEPPWHKLGTLLDKPPTTAEAIKAAGLDWRVRKAPLMAYDTSGVLDTPWHAVVRDPVKGEHQPTVLGVVGEEYHLLQNAQAFAFFDPLLKSGNITLETAGALGVGERVWVMAKVDGDFDVVIGDPVQQYLLLANSHDGSCSVQVKFTPVRVVCQNTLNMALSDNLGLHIRHNRSMRGRLADAQLSLEVILDSFGQIKKMLQAMAGVKMTAPSLEKYLLAVMPEPRQAHDEAARRRIEMIRRRRNHARQLFETGMGQQQQGTRGTLWAAYNAVTELADHHLQKAQTSRYLESAWFGEGDQLKRRALQEARRVMAAPLAGRN